MKNLLHTFAPSLLALCLTIPFAAPSAKMTIRKAATNQNDWPRSTRTPSNTIPPKNASANSDDPRSSATHKCGA